MATNLKQAIESIVARAAAEIHQAVRQSIAEQISDRSPASAGGARAARAQPRQAARSAGSSRVRRTDSQVAADDARILDYVKAHPGTNSIAVQRALKLPKPIVSSGLKRLRDRSKLKAKGTRSATRYTAGR
jgi:hypothetical protein